MTNPVNPLGRNLITGNTSNNQSFFGGLRNRITSLFRNRSENSQTLTSVANLTGALPVSEELKNILY